MGRRSLIIVGQALRLPTAEWQPARSPYKTDQTLSDKLRLPTWESATGAVALQCPKATGAVARQNNPNIFKRAPHQLRIVRQALRLPRLNQQPGNGNGGVSTGCYGRKNRHRQSGNTCVRIRCGQCWCHGGKIGHSVSGSVCRRRPLAEDYCRACAPLAIVRIGDIRIGNRSGRPTKRPSATGAVALQCPKAPAHTVAASRALISFFSNCAMRCLIR